MAEIKKPLRVLVITGLIYKNDFRVNKVLTTLSKDLGDVSLQSEVIPFTHTAYYNKEMGDNLLRQWFVFNNLVVPDVLAELKHRSNEIEQSFISEKGGRIVNIDPGFITMSSLILASTKNFSHRIYIGKGIYAEVTLIYKSEKFVSLEWTYPDYREALALDFFMNARHILKEKLAHSSF
ncbi:MAG: DUF4416 family protein [bacterium]